jgi:hypothetical protein
MRCRQCQKLLNAIARVGFVFCVACLVGSAHGHDPHPVHDRYTGDTLPNYATSASSSTRSTDSFKLNWGRVPSSSKNNHMDDLRAKIAQKEGLLVSLESGELHIGGRAWERRTQAYIDHLKRHIASLRMLVETHDRA